MWTHEGRTWHLGEIEFVTDIESTGEMKVSLSNTISEKNDNKGNLSTNFLFLQNDENARTTFLHSTDEMLTVNYIWVALGYPSEFA